MTEIVSENCPDTTQDQPEQLTFGDKPTSNADHQREDPLSLIARLDSEIMKRWNTVRGRLELSQRNELSDALNTFNSVSAVAKADGDVARVEAEAKTFCNKADSLIDKAGVPDPAETANSADVVEDIHQEDDPGEDAEDADKPTHGPPSEHQTKLVGLIARHKDIDPEVAGSVLVDELKAAKKAAKEAVRKGAGNAPELVSAYAKAVVRVETIVAEREHNPDESVSNDTDASEPASPSEMFETLRDHFHGMHQRNPFGRWRTAEELKELAEQKPDPIIVTVKGRDVIVHQRNTIVCGKPGSGKTWIVLFAAINAVLGGGRVVIFNHEEGHEQGTARLQERLQTLCSDESVWRDSILVVEPAQWTAEQLEEIREISIEWLNGAEVKANSLVVLDSISRAGGAVNDANEFNDWWNINIEPWAGIGVICVAHESKIDPRGPLGSVAAMAFFDTVLRVKCAHGQSMWTSETEGCITVYVLKDRHSDSGKSSGDAVAVIIGTPNDGQLTFTVKDVEHLPDAGDPPPPRDLRADIIKLIKANGGTYTKSFRKMRDELDCSQNALNDTLKGLVDEDVLDKISHGTSYHYKLIDG